MLNKTIIIAHTFVLMLLLQTPSFAHFIHGEPNEEPQTITETDNWGYVDFIKDESIYDIMDKASKLNKPIFIDFYAEWCGPCRIMDQEVFSKSSVAKYMNSNYINYKVDTSSRSGNNLAYRYNVKMLPTFIIINPKGDMIAKETGLMDSEEFIDFAKNANTTIY